MRNFKFIWSLIIVGCLSVACAPRRPSVVIKQGSPQQFIISADGLLDVFTISGPTTSGGMDKYWVIAPLDPNFDVSKLSAPLVYGQTPPGFRQVAPLNGQPPPPIIEGSPYSVELDIRNGHKVHMLFAVRNGKIITEADAD